MVVKDEAPVDGVADVAVELEDVWDEDKVGVDEVDVDEVRSEVDVVVGDGVDVAAVFDTVVDVSIKPEDVWDVETELDPSVPLCVEMEESVDDDWGAETHVVEVVTNSETDDGVEWTSEAVAEGVAEDVAEDAAEDSTLPDILILHWCRASMPWVRQLRTLSVANNVFVSMSEQTMNVFGWK